MKPTQIWNDLEKFSNLHHQTKSKWWMRRKTRTVFSDQWLSNFFFLLLFFFRCSFRFFFLLFYLIFFSDTTIISLITVIVIVFSYWDNKNTILSLTLAIWIDMVLQTRELVSYCGKVNESIDGTSTLASPRNMAPQDPLYFLE